MKKIKLLTTGGTIACEKGEGGLTPAPGPSNLLRYIGELGDRFIFEYEDLFSMDSSNIQPEQWQVIARRAFEALFYCDGVIITHGTDTMAYTAAALSFMLRGLSKPVVLTGSQVPISDPLTDARVNLCTAAAAVEAGMKGVLVAFDRKVFNGVRAVKTSTLDFNAFNSVGAMEMARIYADGIRVFKGDTAEEKHPPRLIDAISTDVFLLKLIPGTSPAIFDALLNIGYRGIVIEAFGAGGMHYLHRDLLGKVKQLCGAGVTVAVCSQCLYERSDLGIYEVGKLLLEAGAISAMDMTTEAAVTKLMWVLGQTGSPAEVRSLFLRNLVGELTLN
jgi:L-asparaginase